MAIPKDFDESLLLLGGKRQKVRNKRDVMVAGEVQRGVKKRKERITWSGASDRFEITVILSPFF